jgi:hypothetical protein
MSIIYGEPASEYHSNGALGSSLLRDFIRSSQLYKDKIDGLVPSKSSPAMVFGSLAHMAILEPERFAAETVQKPDGMSFATKEGKSWREQNSGREIITFDDAQTIKRLVGRMPGSVRDIISNGKSEVTFRNELAGRSVQCRADSWIESGNLLYDLKTISAIEKIDRSIFDRGYHIQIRWYQRIIAAETGTIPQARLIFVETAAPYRWRTVLLDAEYTAMADREIDEALRGIAQCEKDGDWSDEQSEIQLASPPSWTQEFTEDEDGGISL